MTKRDDHEERNRAELSGMYFCILLVSLLFIFIVDEMEQPDYTKPPSKLTYEHLPLAASENKGKVVE